VEFAVLKREGDKTVFSVLDSAKVAAVLAKVPSISTLSSPPDHSRVRPSARLRRLPRRPSRMRPPRTASARTSIWTNTRMYLFVSSQSYLHAKQSHYEFVTTEFICRESDEPVAASFGREPDD
jgi:hypothetical protein